MGDINRIIIGIYALGFVTGLCAGLAIQAFMI